MKKLDQITLRLDPAPDAMFGHRVLTPDDVILAQSHDLDLAAKVVRSFNAHDDLLQALKFSVDKMLSAIELYKGKGLDAKFAAPIFHARAAIAKAEGRTP